MIRKLLKRFSRLTRMEAQWLLITTQIKFNKILTLIMLIIKDYKKFKKPLNSSNNNNSNQTILQVACYFKKRYNNRNIEFKTLIFRTKMRIAMKKRNMIVNMRTKARHITNQEKMMIKTRDMIRLEMAETLK